MNSDRNSIDNYSSLTLRSHNMLEKSRKLTTISKEDSDSFLRSRYRRYTKLSEKLETGESKKPSLTAIIRFQARVRSLLARETFQLMLDIVHKPRLLFRHGKRVKTNAFAWISIVQFPRSEEWVIQVEEVQGNWRLDARIGPNHAWRLYDLHTIAESLDMTSDDQLVLNVSAKTSSVHRSSVLPAEISCRKLVKFSGKPYWLTAKLDNGAVILAIEGSKRERFKPLAVPILVLDVNQQVLEEEVTKLLSRLTLQNNSLLLREQRDPGKGFISYKMTKKVQATNEEILITGRRRINGKWFAITITKKTVEKMNSGLMIFTVEAQQDLPSTAYISREYQLSDILGKLNLWSEAEIKEMGEELLDHVQIDGGVLDLNKEKCGYLTAKQELLTVTKTLNNGFDYELVFLYNVAVPTKLTIEARPLEYAPELDHSLNLDLVTVNQQFGLTSGKVTSEDLGKIVELVDLNEEELALLPTNVTVAAVPTLPDPKHTEETQDSQISKKEEPEGLVLTHFQLAAIIRMQAFFRMKLIQRSWEPVNNPSPNLLFRRCKVVNGKSYLVTVMKSKIGILIEAIRTSDFLRLTKNIDHPAAYAFGYSKIEDYQLLVDSLTESEEKLALRKGRKPGKSVNSINISELDVSFFHDEEQERHLAAMIITHFFRRLMLRKRFRRVVEDSSRKLLLCKRKDMGNGVNLISIFQEENELILEICDPYKKKGEDWKVQKMRLNLKSLGEGNTSLELILERVKMVDGELVAPELSDLKTESEMEDLMTPKSPPVDIRTQLLTRVRSFDGRKALVTATLVLKVPEHKDPLPTDLLEFELTPDVSDQPSKPSISIQEAAFRLGLPIDRLIPIANLTISKLLSVKNGLFQLDSDRPSPVIHMDEVASSIQASARGFMVRAKYSASLKQLKSYLVAMTEMEFFNQPYIVYAYQLDDKYKIEAVHRRLKYGIMVLIDEGLIRRFKFGSNRKKVFEEAVFPRLFMVEEDGFLRLCLNPNLSSPKPSIRSGKSSKMTDFSVSITRGKEENREKTVFGEEERVQDFPIHVKNDPTSPFSLPFTPVSSQPVPIPRLPLVSNVAKTDVIPQKTVPSIPLIEVNKEKPLDRIPTKPKLKPPLVIPKLPMIETSSMPEPSGISQQTYHIDVVLKPAMKMEEENEQKGKGFQRTNSVPTDDIRRIRRIQARNKPQESLSTVEVTSALMETQSISQILPQESQKKTESAGKSHTRFSSSQKTASGFDIASSVSPIFRKTFVQSMKSSSMRSLTSKRSQKPAPKPFHSHKELVLKTGHVLGDSYCIVSFFRLRKSAVFIEAVETETGQTYTCKAVIAPDLTTHQLDEVCEGMLLDLKLLKEKDGKWKLGFRAKKERKEEEDFDFFVV